MATKLNEMRNAEILADYPAWLVVPIGTPTPWGAQSFELWRRADTCTIIGSSDEWKFSGAYPSRACAIGEAEETEAAEARDLRVEQRRGR